MSTNDALAALATLDLIESLCHYRARLHTLGRMSGCTELDAAIEQARSQLTCLCAPDDTADRTRFVELINEFQAPRLSRSRDR